MAEQLNENTPTTTNEVLDRIPLGFGVETGLERSIPAVRVWGIVQFERSFSGNEASGMNEVFTDVEPFLSNEGELDARARVRATKLNYVRENLFRSLIREIARPYLKEISSAVAPTSSSADSSNLNYTGIVEKVFDDVLSLYFSGGKLENYRMFFRALIAKTATCTPYDSCGACPACIAEGAASTTAVSGVSLPHNWEKKFKEIDFKTFKTVKSANTDQEIPLDGNIIEFFLTETLMRNRTPRSQGVEAGSTVENAVEAERSSEAMMLWREHMFSGKGYAKTTLFNPTKLELAMLADEWLVNDVRRGAKTSSGAGVWQIVSDNGEPMLVVDEILKRRGFVESAPIAAMPVDVNNDTDGIRKCFGEPKTTTDGNLIKRYVGTAAVERLKKYHEHIELLEPNDETQCKRAFFELVTYCASVVAHLIEPSAVVKKLKASFEGLKNKDEEILIKAFQKVKNFAGVKEAVESGEISKLNEATKTLKARGVPDEQKKDVDAFDRARKKIREAEKLFSLLRSDLAAAESPAAKMNEETK